MEIKSIEVNKSDLSVTRQDVTTSAPLEENQILVEIENIGLSANNISYAATGDALGYWSYFSKEQDWGIVPVWGFGRVIESKNPSITVGEKVFGILPMESHVVLTPGSISDIAFSDASSNRAELHPWYNRYYRCINDPVFNEQTSDIQPVLWALFMTGWMMAEELRDVDCVYISSASSKTALSLGWALKNCGNAVETVGITSSNNQKFVDDLDVYSKTVTYDQIGVDSSVSKAAYVDIAGNAQATSDMHVALDDKLQDSVLIGSTHRAPSVEPLPMPGPTPRFFFIPNVAEEKAAEIGFDTYHQNFSDDWHRFAAWSNTWLEFEHGSGADAIESGYLANLAGGIPANRAMVFTWK